MKTLQRALTRTFGSAGMSQAQRELNRIKAQQRSASSRAMTKARELAEKHGITIERDGTRAYWVTVDSLSGDAKDPLDGNHFCTDGAEVLAAVEVYAEHLTKAAP